VFRSSPSRRALWLLGATVFLATCLVAQPATGWNVNSRLDLVFSVVDQGRVSIDSYHDRKPYATGDKAFYNGHYYSDKTFGVSVVAMPVYGLISGVSRLLHLHPSFQLIQFILTRWAVALPAALAAMLLANLLIRLGAIPRLAVLATSGVFFGSMLFGYSTVFYPYVPGIACCLGALTLIWQVPVRLRRLAFAGLLLGAALVFDLTFNISVAVIGVLLLLAVRRERRARAVQLVAAAAAAALLPIGAFAVYSAHIFGSPTIPYKYEASDYFRRGMANGVMGVTTPKFDVMWFLSFHPFRGVLFWSPWLVMVVVCGIWLARRDARLRAVAIASVVTLVAYFLFNAGYYEWWGGSTMGPRLMIPMFAVVPLALVAACRADSPVWMRAGLVATMAAGVALSLPLSMTEPQTKPGNSIGVLTSVRVGQHLHVPQLDVLRSFYRLDWTGMKHVWVFPIGLSFAMCMLVVFGGTALAYLVAAEHDGLNFDDQSAPAYELTW
jgi:hypothetical protein